jgi:hypothetical protein
MRQDELIEFEELQSIQISTEVDYTFLLHWVRRVGLRELLGDLGVRLRSPRAARLQIAISGDFRMIKSIDDSGQMRLRVYKKSGAAERTISVTATAPAPRESDRDPLLKVVYRMTAVRDAIYGRAAECLEAKYSQLISRILDETSQTEPLLDVSFPNSEHGLEAWLTAVNGDFTTALQPGADLATHRGALTRDFTHEPQIELFLPYLDRKDWKFPARVLARARIHSNLAGQIFVGWPARDYVENTLRVATFAAIDKTSSASSFTVSHTGPPDEFGTEIMRQIPGNYLTMWLDAPGDRDSMYGPVYGEIALVVQKLLREELPRRWFSKSERYARFADSFAILVYKCSRPFVGKTRTEFSYEFQLNKSMRRFFRTAAQALPAELNRIQPALARASCAETYHRKATRAIIDAVQTRRQHLDRLMSAESTIIECFIEFGIRGNECRNYLSSHPEDTAEQIARYTEAFARALNCRVRRIHPALDTSDLALLLLMEASNALSGMMRGQSGILSVLHEQTPRYPIGIVSYFGHTARTK